jgi:hypothetical protein
MRAFAASALALFSGCWGAGPVPSKPEQATILYQLTPPGQNECGQQKYIGPVAFGPAYGFAGLLPYQPQQGCNNSGSMVGSTEVEVYEFPVEGDGEAQRVGIAGMSDGSYSPRLLARQNIKNDVVWVSTPGPNMGPSGEVDFAGTTPAFAHPFSVSGGFYAPAALAFDASGFFVAAVQVNTGTKWEPNNPNYPCCGPTQTPSTSLFAHYDPDTDAETRLPISPLLDCGHSTRCVVETPMGFVYLAFESNTSSANRKIALFPPDGTSEMDERPLSQLTLAGVIPVGFHASENNVFWSMSRSYDQGGTQATPRCEIDQYDLVTPREVGPIFTTDRFDCAGISTDDESVYFTIVEVTFDNGGQQMRGLGIGRVHLGTGEVETIRIGVFGSSTGPRRVLIDTPNVIVVDPFTIARIPMSALDGQHDFAL